MLQGSETSNLLRIRSTQPPRGRQPSTILMVAQKKQITRDRTSYSCQTCRQRKIKCDKIHPACGACQKAAAECVYGDADKVPAQQATQQLFTVRKDGSRKRRAIEDGNDGNDMMPSMGIKAIEQKLNQLSSLVHDIRRLAPETNDGSPSGSRYDHWATTSHHGTATEVCNGNSPQSARHETPHTFTVDYEAPWADVLGKLDQINNLLRSETRVHSSPIQGRSAKETQKADLLPSSVGISAAGVADPTPMKFQSFQDDPAGHSLFEQHMLAPTEEESNVLFRSWLFSVYPVLPIIHPRLVLQKYEAFNHWYRHGMDKGEPHPDSSFMPYLTLVWYTGYINLSSKAKDRWFPWMNNTSIWIQRLRARLENQLDIMKIEASPSIWVLAASTTSQYLALGGQSIISNRVRNTLNISTAQSLGLYSEKLLKTLDATEAEMKRRLWWETVSLDTAISTLSGTPVILDEVYTDTKMMSELKEVSVGTTEGEEYEEHLNEPETQPDRPDNSFRWQASSLVSVYHLTMKARHRLMATTKKVLKANMSVMPLKMDEFNELRRLSARTSKEVHAIIDRIPCRGVPELGFTPGIVAKIADTDHPDSMGLPVTVHEMGFFLREHPDSPSSAGLERYHKTATIAFHKWARVTLSMLVDRLGCISYAIFLKNPKSRMWAVARNCALKCCHNYMRKFLSLAEDPELRKFRWAWSSMYHLIHATIILLIDLHERPHSDEAALSRAMIDKMFSLSSPGKGLADERFTVPLKEGGTEAWTMLRSLRHRAWQKAGLDPDVLWSEENQTSVGVGMPLKENDLFMRSLREDIVLTHRERLNRHGLGEVSKAHSIQPSSRAAIRDAAKQCLHPSVLDHGDRVDGPVVRELADLDTGLHMPPILLLRASHGQELMPYPANGVDMQLAGAQQRGHEDNDALLRTRPNPGMEGAEVSHIGELIKKIRESRPTSTSAQKLRTSTTNNDYGLHIQPGKDSCDFRAVREAESAASEDLFLRPAPSDFLSIDNTHGQVPASSDPAVLKCRLYNAPSASAFDVSKANVDAALLTPTAQQRQDSPTSDQPGGLLHKTTMFPAMDSLGALGTTQPQGPSTNSRQNASGTHLPAQPLPQTQVQPSTIIVTSPADYFANPEGADNPFATNAGFNWDEWDETFGQYAGFEDMLLDESNPLA